MGICPRAIIGNWVKIPNSPAAVMTASPNMGCCVLVMRKKQRMPLGEPGKVRYTDMCQSESEDLPLCIAMNFTGYGVGPIITAATYFIVASGAVLLSLLTPILWIGVLYYV